MITKTCEFCGKEFSRYSSYFKNRAGRFCSKKCDLNNNSIIWKIDNPLKYFDNSGENNPMFGKKPWNFNPNGSMRKDGYIRLTINGKRVLKHRMLVEKMLGRKLLDWEIVHHKDGNNRNNNLNNLQVMSQSEHERLHDPRGWRRLLNKDGGDKNPVSAAQVV